ncbi:hypothetical protein NMY22_g7945 [Coprinellus aureogranulatus]|nr:hypothetical protein NMY22_g7945 [Coprinellus aureogranulatus]
MDALRAQKDHTNDVNRLFQSRAASESEASSLKPLHNHLYAGSLHELLDARKSVTSRRDLESLARKYNLDVEKLEKLSRVVNSPSVDSRLNVKTVDTNGDESMIYTAVWVDPRTESSA